MDVINMDDEVYSFALKNALNEIQKICPDIRNSFMFKEDGEIIAADENTPERTIVNVVNALDGLLEKANALGSIEFVALESSKGKVNLSCINDYYFVTVTSKKADLNYVNTVTRVLIPTIIKLLEKIGPAPFKNNPSRFEIEPEHPRIEEAEATAKRDFEETVPETVEKPLEHEVKSEPLLPEPPVNQLIVENIGGLLVPSDTVRIDNETLLQWNELYGDRNIEEVDIETFGGKSTRCKVKPIKDSKYEGRGVIQMPDKIRTTLEIKKGELVRVKPAVQ